MKIGSCLPALMNMITLEMDIVSCITTATLTAGGTLGMDGSPTAALTGDVVITTVRNLEEAALGSMRVVMAMDVDDAARFVPPTTLLDVCAPIE